MSCSPFDLNDYFLEELPVPKMRQVEAHVKTCRSCAEELDRLRIMGAALRSVPDEEIPQRIAFVSDKIFEPSPWRRWLAAFWNSGARLGFAGAAMLSASLSGIRLRRPSAGYHRSHRGCSGSRKPDADIGCGAGIGRRRSNAAFRRLSKRPWM